MSKKYPGGLITKTPVAPAGPFQNGAASGVWTLSQAAYWQEQGLWPIAGNENNFAAYNSTKDTALTDISGSVTLPYTTWFEVTDEYTLTVFANLVLDIDIWGGGGGGGSYWSNPATMGGAGGYSYARGVQLAAGTYKFVVGAGGRGGIKDAGESQATMDSLNEGFGNGGLGTQANYSGFGNNNGGCAGGFSGIFSTSTAFANALFISGGGGGAGTAGGNNGGQGGGGTGSDGAGPTAFGRKGTQSAGGIAQPTPASTYTPGQAGSQLQGGNGGISSILGTGGGGFGGGGGGGGYYGGGSVGTKASSGMGGGGGGSGYTTTTLTMTSSGSETATVKMIPTTKATGAPTNTSAGYGATGSSGGTHPTVDGFSGAIKFTITGTF